MKEEALKLADMADGLAIELPADWSSGEPKNVMTEISAMIRRLVEELDKHKKIDGVFDYYCDENIRSKQTKPTITKLDGKVVAVTMTDDDHRITEVLWEAPKPLSDEEIREICKEVDVCFDGVDTYRFAKAIEERHGIK